MPSTRRFVSFLQVTTILLLAAATCLSQNASNSRGFQPGNSFAVGDFETINMSNGNLMLNFPMGALPAGRNGLSASINLVYNSKQLDSTTKYFVKEETCEMQGQEPDARMVCDMYQRTVLKHAGEQEGGWRLNWFYALKLVDRWDELSEIPQHLQPLCWANSGQISGPPSGEQRFRYKLFLVLPDGSKHEMRPSGYSDGVLTDPLADYFDIRPDGYQDLCQQGQPPIWNTGTLTYYSTDGSHLRLDIQHDGNTQFAWMDNPWTLYLPDGAKVTSNQPNEQWQRVYDRNGNYIELLPTGLKDQFNRQVTVGGYLQSGVRYNTVTTQGFGQSLTWTIRYENILPFKSYWPCAAALNCDPKRSAESTTSTFWRSSGSCRPDHVTFAGRKPKLPIHLQRAELGARSASANVSGMGRTKWSHAAVRSNRQLRIRARWVSTF
jgi:hypothetical protein